jgi:hypothetical protein
MREKYGFNRAQGSGNRSDERANHEPLEIALLPRDPVPQLRETNRIA